MISIRPGRLPRANPVEVEVVSLDWKWLFIYPDHGIASVNRLIVPAGTPISFTLTSSGVMNSFFVPQLGSQIYTMAGMPTHLHLQADKPGAYPGLSAQFSGDGFSDMRFTVDAVSPDAFAHWVDAARKRRPDTRRGRLCRAREAEQGSRPLHLPLVAPVCSRHRAPPCTRMVRGPAHPREEGGKVNRARQADLERDSDRTTDHHGPSVVMVLVIVARPVAGSPPRATGPICGASGSPRSITSASA